MTGTEIAGATALVTGASRGFGRGITEALAAAGAHVVGVARDREALAQLRGELGDSFTPVVADVTDPNAAGHLIDAHRPGILVLNAGASPLPRPLHQHTWQSFSQAWDVDVKHAFHWTREALLAPLAPGSTVVAMSSGAALQGSPLSGGYAGAKATIRFLTGYAAGESDRAGLGIRFVSVLPRLTPATELGSHAVKAYAAYYGMDVAGYIASQGPALTPEQAGKSITDLIAGAGAQDAGHGAYLLTSEGLRSL
jgi:NAD(P)-dependent dehydrogenase (short-subunit alcohol dehydrogenase family)